MNEQLSILIIGQKLSSIPYLDKISGIAKAYPLVQEGEGRTVVKRIPISTYTTLEQCSAKTIHQYDLIPDSRLKGMLYFEELAPIRLIERRTAGNRYESSLRLICWLNPQILDKNESPQNVATKVLTDVVKRITEDQLFHDPAQTFASVTIDVTAIPEKTSQLFSRYDYDEKVTQYLMYPFDYFAIDLSVKYLIPFKICNDYYNP